MDSRAEAAAGGLLSVIPSARGRTLAIKMGGLQYSDVRVPRELSASVSTDDLTAVRPLLKTHGAVAMHCMMTYMVSRRLSSLVS